MGGDSGSHGETRAAKIMQERSSGDSGEMGDLRDMPSGGILWKASLVLLDWLERNQTAALKGKRVLELGSGEGHLAIELCRMGAHVTATEQVAQGALQRLQSNVATASSGGEGSELMSGGGSIQALELEWGEAGWGASGLGAVAGEAGFDVVVMSELVFDDSAHEALMWTLDKALSRTGIAFSGFLNRPFSMMWFVMLADAGGWKVDPVPESEVNMLGLQTTDLHMHIITREA